MARPLRLLVLLITVALIIASCGDDDDSPDDVAAEEELPAEQEAPVEDESAGAAESPAEDTAAASGIEVGGVTFDTSKALILNMGDSEVSLEGYFLCNRPTYVPLPPLTLLPGEGIEVEVETFDAAGGEAALYTSDDFGDSDDMVSYVQWGSGGGRASVAEAAGLWAGVPAEPGPTGVFLIGEPGSAAGWE